MAKHHPDLIFCRKQPGVGKIVFPIQYYQEIIKCNFFPLQPLVVCAKNATESVSFATRTSDRALWLEYVTNAITVLIRDVV